MDPPGSRGFQKDMEGPFALAHDWCCVLPWAAVISRTQTIVRYRRALDKAPPR